MKLCHFVSFLACLILFFISCNKENAPDLIKSTGKKITATRYLNGYHSITSFDHIDIEIKQGNEYKAEITGGKNLIPKIVLEVKDSMLTVKNRNTANWVRDYRKDDIKITLYVPTLKRIEQFGSGIIYCKDTLKSDDLGIDMQSSGDFDLVVDCRRFVCVQYRRNYGNIKVRGRCTQLISVNDGTGQFNSLGLICQYARIETINKGESYAHVPGPLAVKIVDSGNIYISGNPNPIQWLGKTGNGSLLLLQ